MKVFCIRHGAANFSKTGGLSKLGRSQIKKAAETLKVMKITGENVLIFTSSITRATQSARIIARICNIRGPQILEWLSCDRCCRFSDLRSLVSKLQNENLLAIILVSHSPNIGNISGIYPENGEIVEIDINSGCSKRLI